MADTYTRNVGTDRRVSIEADESSRVLVTVHGSTVYYGSNTVTSSSNDGNITDGNSTELGKTKYFISAGSSQLVVTPAAPQAQRDEDILGDLTVEGDVSVTGEVGATVEGYADDGSKQANWGDLDLAAAAGTSTQGDTSFLAGIMGNIIGSALTKTHNFIGGLIGAYTVDTSNASLLQKGGVLGIVMDGAVSADGAVVAIIDGGDPSSVTRANAAFKAAMNNNNASSGVDYGLDLYDAGRDSTLYSGGGLALPIANAQVRFSNQVCLLTGAGVPSDGTTGDNFAAKGSLYIDTTNGKLYINTGAITNPTWVVAGTQS